MTYGHEGCRFFTLCYAEAVAGIIPTEGSIGDEEARFLGNLVRGKGEIVVAQTGLGMGKSAWAFLAANKHLRLFSFDVMGQEMTEQVAKIIAEQFYGRHIIVKGDSKKTVPGYPLDDCPLVFIDGGHDLETAMTDLTSFHKVGRTVVMDDVYHGSDVLRAWEFHRGLKKVVQLLHQIEFHPQGEHVARWEWVMGVYV